MSAHTGASGAIAKDLPRIFQADARLIDRKTNPPLKESTIMPTSHFTKPVVGAALTAGTLTLAALLAAGAANAQTPDEQFLGMLQDQGISFGATQAAIGVAHHVCDSLGGGMEPSDISSNIAAANPGIDRQTALVIVVAAAQSYCPQFVHQMANGATVVGPNH
jgi:hypothetical protein